MAVADGSTPAPPRRLSRAAGPCLALTTTDLLALVGGEDSVAVEAAVGRPAAISCPTRTAASHARVLRQHGAGSSPRTSKGIIASFRQCRHSQFSRSVLPPSVWVRS